MMQNISDEEFFRFKHLIRDGAAFVHIEAPAMPDHYKVGNTIISYALGRKLIHWHLAPSAIVSGPIKLMSGKVVEGRTTTYAYHE